MNRPPRPSSRIVVKRAVARVVDACGLTAVLRFAHRRQSLILGYHRVLPPDSPDLEFVQPGMYVTIDTFRAHLDFLKRHYDIVPLGALVAGGHERGCAITFDDGWRDNYVHALPLLEEAGAAATVFLPTNFVGTAEWPWADRACYYLRYGALGRVEGALGEAYSGFEAPPLRALSDHEARAEALLEAMKRLPHDRLLRAMRRLDEWFPELLERLKGNRPWVTWDEVAEMARRQVAFGSHTETHVILSNVPREDARREIAASRQALSARLGRPVEFFCYPNGYHDPALVELVRDAGYAGAVTTRRGFAEPSSGPLTMNRVLVHDDIGSSVPMFACILTNSLPFF